MEKVIKIFKQLQSTNSKKEKIAIIKANAENGLFKRCLVFLFDNNVVTGISKKKINKKLNFQIKGLTPINKLKYDIEWESCMDYIKKHNTGTDVDIYWLQMFIDCQPEEYQEFYKQLITKTLKLGCDTKSVNAAIPNLIPVWEVQLGSGYNKLKLKLNETFYLSKKLNGNRCSYYNSKLISRQGKEFKGFQYIIDDIETLIGTKYFIDGELIRDNIDGLSDGENFRIGTGIINSDLEDKKGLKLVIFDIFPSDQLNNKKSKCTYKVRKEFLNGLREDIVRNNIQNLEIVEMVYEGTDTNEIDNWLNYAVKHDWEGLMLNKDTVYECKRTSNLIKIKRFYTMDLEVVDVLEGDGRLKGTLGALVVKYKDNVVNVGSGYSDEQRALIWNDKEDMIGRIVEVKYKEISKSKDTGLESLQFPVFVQIRENGKEVSYN